MNRLRDESGLDPISEKGIEMLRSVRPTSSSPLLKRRVWAALQESTIASPVRQRSSMLRVLVIGVGAGGVHDGDRRCHDRPPANRGADREALGAPRRRRRHAAPARANKAGSGRCGISESSGRGDPPGDRGPRSAGQGREPNTRCGSPPARAQRAADVEARSSGGGDDAGARAGLGGAGCAPARSRSESCRRVAQPRAGSQPSWRSPSGGPGAGDRSGRCPRRPPGRRELCSHLSAGVSIRPIQAAGPTLSR